MKKKKENFTLIELLVVISIIAILAAMLLPAIGSIRKAARNTKARTLANAIVMAVKQYETTYGVLPASSSDVNSDEQITSTKYDPLITILSQVKGPGGKVTDGNLRKEVFLSVPSTYGTSKGYLDPWGHPFVIGIDVNYDKEIKLHGETLHGVTFVYSLGADGKDKTSDDVLSWQ